MPPKNSSLMNYLEKSRAIRTLLCLFKEENKGLDEVLKEIGGSKSTGMMRVQELVELGLVTKVASQTEKRKMLYHLNKKGKRIAEELEALIESYSKE